MRARPFRQTRARRREPDDDGSVLLLTLGYGALALVAILVCADATSLYLAQKRLDSLADAAALAAADGFVLSVDDGEPVAWELAADERFATVVARGRVEVRADEAHSVHVVASGLAPGRWYWYRFTAGDARSEVGRTRTAPSRGRCRSSQSMSCHSAAAALSR